MRILLDKVKEFPEEEKQKYLDHEMRVRDHCLCSISYTACVHIATTLDMERVLIIFHIWNVRSEVQVPIQWFAGWLFSRNRLVDVTM